MIFVPSSMLWYNITIHVREVSEMKVSVGTGAIDGSVEVLVLLGEFRR